MPRSTVQLAHNPGYGNLGALGHHGRCLDVSVVTGRLVIGDGVLEKLVDTPRYGGRRHHIHHAGYNSDEVAY